MTAAAPMGAHRQSVLRKTLMGCRAVGLCRELPLLCERCWCRETPAQQLMGCSPHRLLQLKLGQEAVWFAGILRHLSKSSISTSLLHSHALR